VLQHLTYYFHRPSADLWDIVTYFLYGQKGGVPFSWQGFRFSSTPCYGIPVLTILPGANVRGHTGYTLPREWLGFMAWLFDLRVQDGRLLAARPYQIAVDAAGRAYFILSAKSEASNLGLDAWFAEIDHRLAQALAEEADVRDRLADLQQQALSAECSGLLLDEIETEFRQRHEPPLLHAARERFAAFTHHAWDLAVGDDNRFHAIETASGDPHELDELSTATRMQLLLALRTSWAEHQEQGRMSLPFMLDEALTTSDPERFASVAASLQQLASERGRQVIYLAAGGHEPWLWQQATGRTPRLIDLAAVRRGLERAEFSPAPASATPPPTWPRPSAWPMPSGWNSTRWRLEAPSNRPAPAIPSTLPVGMATRSSPASPSRACT